MQRREPVRCEEIGLVEDDEVGAGQLVGENLLERVVVINRRVGRALLRNRRGIGGETAVGCRRGIDDGDDAVDRHAGADLGPGESLHQRLWQRQPGGLDDDMAGRFVAVDQPAQGR